MTNHRPYHELDMPVIFSLPQKITLELNNEVAFELQTENISCSHEYVISAWFTKDNALAKQLLYYSISIEMEN